jgi:hypothetical protein
MCEAGHDVSGGMFYPWECPVYIVYPIKSDCSEKNTARLSWHTIRAFI